MDKNGFQKNTVPQQKIAGAIPADSQIIYKKRGEKDVDIDEKTKRKNKYKR